MDTVEKIMDGVMRFLLALFMFALVAGGFWQIFTRWILNDPSTVTDEFLRYTLIWASLIGSAYCFYRDEHLSLDLIKDRVKGPVAVVLTIFIEAAILFFVGYVFLYGGFSLANTASNVSSVLKLPFQFLYAIIPLCGVFIILARILKYVRLFASKKGGDA